MWIIAAVCSAVFAALTSILAKCGIKKTNSNLATAMRTVVVLVFASLIVLIVGSWSTITHIEGKSWLFLILSGLATCSSWLCYYYAVQNGELSVVVPIDKMSILLTVLFSWAFLKEKISRKAVLGLCLMCVGAFLMAVMK